jgi:hypothetical protein
LEEPDDTKHNPVQPAVASEVFDAIILVELLERERERECVSRNLRLYIVLIGATIRTGLFGVPV